MSERFWISDPPHHTVDAEHWTGVVDELAGGIVAYFSTEEEAQAWIKFKTEEYR